MQVSQAVEQEDFAVVGNHTPIIQRVSIDGAGKLTITDLVKERPVRKTKPTRSIARRVATKVTVAGVKDIIAKASPYEKKLTKAQKYYDDGKSIRWIAEKLGMDRESLGKNLVR